MSYWIVVLSVLVVGILFLLQIPSIQPEFAKQFFGWMGNEHAQARVGVPSIVTASVTGFAVSLIAAIIGVRAIRLYGGKFGTALAWMVAGFIFIAGIAIMELPSHLGLTKFELVQNTLAHSMQLFGMISIVIGLQKLIKTAK